MQICPYCASTDIYYSRKRKCYLCEDCDQRFDHPSVEKGMRLFISYGHDENSVLVNRIKEFLTKKGYDVWIDSSSIPKGQDWRARITDGLVASNGVLAFLSRHSVRKPGVCLEELRIALRLKHSYVKSVLLESKDEVEPPYHLSEKQWINMADWKTIPAERWDCYFQGKMAELLEALESDDAKSYEEEMNYIGRILNTYDSTSKEVRLMKEEFVGREWLAELVQNWFEHDPNSRMILYGVPGSGKSAFAAHFSHFSIDVIAELFFSWDSTFFASADQIIRLLACKLAASVNDYRRMLKTILEKDRSGEKNLEHYHGSALFDWLILDPIGFCIDGNRERSLIIIDGLDEVSTEIAQLLFRKAAQFPDWVRFLFTARRDEAAAVYFASAKTVFLDQNEQRNTADILDYVSARLGIPVAGREIQAVKDRFEGSFMYAKALCSAVENGQMSLADMDTLPKGLNDFYLDFLKRLFPSRDKYLQVRPFLELLCVEKEMTVPVMCLALNLDKYDLWEMRTNLKSLIIIEKSRRDGQIVRFVHKSISDWLQRQELSGPYYVDVKNGYALLVSACERLRDNRDLALKEISDQADEWNGKRRNIEFEELYPFWLVKANMFNKYHDLLLRSFSREDMDLKRKTGKADYLFYYFYYDLWRWADLFPAEYLIQELTEKLKEIVTYPKTRMCSEFAHRSFQISALLLSNLMQTGRFADVFFEFIRQLDFSSYFMSIASDLDGETRDGWDKYYLTRDAVICLKQLDELRIPVPDMVRRECERMKLTYHLYRGDAAEGMFAEQEHESLWAYGILVEKRLYKDICVYIPENKEMENLKANYNTLSLRYYFIYGEDEDSEYVQRCREHLADIDLAYQSAEKVLSSDEPLPGVSDENKSRRLSYVRVAAGRRAD